MTTKPMEQLEKAIPGFKLSDKVDMEDHARYKYLLNTDGTTASSRLGKLMLINSVLLKEETEGIEYYYRWGGR